VHFAELSEDLGTRWSENYLKDSNRFRGRFFSRVHTAPYSPYQLNILHLIHHISSINYNGYNLRTSGTSHFTTLKQSKRQHIFENFPQRKAGATNNFLKKIQLEINTCLENIKGVVHLLKKKLLLIIYSPPCHPRCP